MKLPDAVHDKLIQIPGSETLSGPRNVVYRRWRAENRVPCVLVYRQYSNDSDVAQIGLLHGVTLTTPEAELVGLLITPDSSSSPWSTRFPPPVGEASKLYLLTRLVAIDSLAVSCGDTGIIRPMLLRQRAETVTTSSSKLLSDESLVRSWSRWLQFLGVSPREASKVLETLVARVKSGLATGQESVDTKIQLRRLSCLLACD